MIPIKDLRIGDLVKTTTRNPILEKGSICKVVLIDALINSIIVQKSDVDVCRCLVKEEIEGIPLTPDILEKNGWGTKMFGGSKFFCIELNCYLELCVTYEKKDNNFSVGTFSHIPGGDLDINYFPIDIQYVHELQNILWALGEDANLKI